MENQKPKPTPPPPNYLPGLLDRNIDVRSLHPATFAQFYIIKRSDGTSTFKNVSPFKIQKFIESDIGSTKSVSRLRDGSLLVQVGSVEMSKKICALQVLGTFPVRVEVHKTLNTCKGVVYSPDLMDIEEDEILKELAKQHVIEVKSIMSRFDGVLKRSPLHILTFNITTLPEHIFVGFIRVSVRPHIPNPLRCLRCQKFGHIQTNCEKPFVCPNCGKCEAHVDKPCDQEIKCINCSGSHPAWSRQCPAWKREKKIMEIKTKDKLSFSEARKQYNTLVPPIQRTYSSVAATTPEGGPSKADMQQLLQTMTLLLAGQQETKKTLDEQAKRIEEQSEKIDKQTEQIKLLREENNTLKQKNKKLEKELSGLQPKSQKTQKMDAVLSAPKPPLDRQVTITSQNCGDVVDCGSPAAVETKQFQELNQPSGSRDAHEVLSEGDAKIVAVSRNHKKQRVGSSGKPKKQQAYSSGDEMDVDDGHKTGGKSKHKRSDFLKDQR
jgi:cell division protein FtsB/Zn finger protein HypA/HybF involved in hydrogenase expression